MKKILLINPKGQLNIPSVIRDAKISGTKGVHAPLSLATIAALTPNIDEVEIAIHDENVHGMIDESYLNKGFDLIGITGYLLDFPRVKTISSMFRKNGIMVAIGGGGITSAPEFYYDIADVSFIGEAEYTWPEFIRNWLRGRHKRKYRQFEKIPMDTSPIPAWHLLGKSIQDYLIGPVQTSRGCVFDCDFCDVIYMFGQRMRYKPIDQVLEEVKLLEHYGFDRVFFVDDNIAGNPRHLKEFLRKLINLNNSFKKPLMFLTQISINIAKDDELLELLADANFGPIFIGIESPNIESLKDINKAVNFKTNMLHDLDKIQSYGLCILMSMMVGFDHDSTHIFDEQFDFIMKASVPQVFIFMVNAPLGTRLWHRLAEEKRLLIIPEGGNPNTTTNIIPKQMNRIELFDGYLSLLKRVYAWENFEKRIEGFLKKIKRRPNLDVKPLVTIRKHYKKLFRLILSILFSPKRRCLYKILKLSRSAPFLFQRMVVFLVWGFVCEDLLKFLEGVLTDRIKQESISPPRVFNMDPYLDLIKKFDYNFIENFLPRVYARIFKECGNIQTTNELVVSVFLEFIHQYKDNFEKLESHHISHLDELCDHAIEGLEKGESVSLKGEESSEESIRTNIIEKFKLDKEIYKVICEELRGEVEWGQLKELKETMV